MPIKLQYITVIINSEQTQTASEVSCTADTYYLSDNYHNKQHPENEYSNSSSSNLISVYA